MSNASIFTPSDMFDRIVSKSARTKFHTVAWNVDTGTVLTRHDYKSESDAIKGIPEVLKRGILRDNTAKVRCEVFIVECERWVSGFVRLDNKPEVTP